MFRSGLFKTALATLAIPASRAVPVRGRSPTDDDWTNLDAAVAHQTAAWRMLMTLVTAVAGPAPDSPP